MDHLSRATPRRRLDRVFFVSKPDPKPGRKALREQPDRDLSDATQQRNVTHRYQVKSASARAWCHQRSSLNPKSEGGRVAVGSERLTRQLPTAQPPGPGDSNAVVSQPASERHRGIEGVSSGSRRWRVQMTIESNVHSRGMPRIVRSTSPSVMLPKIPTRSSKSAGHHAKIRQRHRRPRRPLEDEHQSRRCVLWRVLPVQDRVR